MLKALARVVLGASLLTGAALTTANAANVGSPAPSIPASNELFQQAEVNLSVGIGSGRRYGGYDDYNGYDNFGYNRRRHGLRCEFRRSGCNNFYRGSYYQNRWWLIPGIVIGSNLNNNRRNRSHIQYCADRYRSYDVRSDTWLSNSGERRRCNSPY